MEDKGKQGEQTGSRADAGQEQDKRWQQTTRPGGTGDGRMEHEETGVGAQTKQPRQVWQGAPDGVEVHNKSTT